LKKGTKAGPRNRGLERPGRIGGEKGKAKTGNGFGAQELKGGESEKTDENSKS